MLEFGDTSKTHKHLCPCQMLAGCCCLRANRGQEDGMRRDGNREQKIPRVPPVWGTPVLLCTELVTQLRRMVIHDELMPPQCTWRGDVSMAGEWGTIPRAAGQQSQAPAEWYRQNPSSCHVLGHPTHVCAAGKERGSTEQSSGARAMMLTRPCTVIWAFGCCGFLASLSQQARTKGGRRGADAESPETTARQEPAPGAALSQARGWRLYGSSHRPLPG